MGRAHWLVLSLGIVACGLAPSAPPVPVEGSHTDVMALSGKWTGRYWSEATGRRGTIKFTLGEHADTGYGEVEITFSPSLSLERGAAAIEVPEDHPEELSPPTCTTIGITVVRVDEHLVRGTIDPYWDPDCNCRARTVFEGRLDPNHNRITGTFSTRRESADRRVLAGKWLVDRS